MNNRLRIEPSQGVPPVGHHRTGTVNGSGLGANGIRTGSGTVQLDGSGPDGDGWSGLDSDGGTVNLALRGELDYANSATLQQWLDSWGAQTPKHLVLDVSELSFCDSAGLSVLISAYRRLTRRGGDVTLRGVRGPLRRVVSITGLDSLFTIEAAS